MYRVIPPSQELASSLEGQTVNICGLGELYGSVATTKLCLCSKKQP